MTLTNKNNFCSFCNEYHELRYFGKDLKGEDVFVCEERLSSVLLETMEPADYGVLEDSDLIENTL